MPNVIGIRFKDSGKIYHFDPSDLELTNGEWAIVETVRGPELGRVAGARTFITDDQTVGELKPVLRRATTDDLDNLHHLQQFEPQALEICREKVVEHKLPMQLVKAEYNFDGSRLTFFFTADRRVDFRLLVRDLARTFRTRIELRQIGPRDEAKLLGGIGPCGRLLCCATFLPDFARVSIKFAKDQDLPLNPSKISGVCGRLLCCLSYEHDQYLEIKAELPQRGDWVQTQHGPGEVIAVNVVRENVTVQLGDGNTVDCTAREIGDVRQRVAAEARSRNAEGITPVTQDDGDVDALRALEDHDTETFEPQPGAVAPRAERSAGRPDVAIGASLNRGQRPERPRQERSQERPRQPGTAPDTAGDAAQSRTNRPPQNTARHHLDARRAPRPDASQQRQTSSEPQTPADAAVSAAQAARKRRRRRHNRSQ